MSAANMDYNRAHTHTHTHTHTHPHILITHNAMLILLILTEGDFWKTGEAVWGRVWGKYPSPSDYVVWGTVVSTHTINSTCLFPCLQFTVQ